MPDPFHDSEESFALITGHPLSRRDFLQAAALTGLAVAGASAAMSVPRAARAQDTEARSIVPDDLTATDVAARLGNDPEAIYRFVSERRQVRAVRGRSAWSP